LTDFQYKHIGTILEIISTLLLTVKVEPEILSSAGSKGKKKEKKTGRHVKSHKDTTRKEEYKHVVK
jgi:hypothetical protein